MKHYLQYIAVIFVLIIVSLRLGVEEGDANGSSTMKITVGSDWPCGVEDVPANYLKYMEC